MSTVFDPNTLLALASSTDTSPISCVTSTSHGLTTGDEVAIEAHLVNVAANGLHHVTFVDAVTFTLAGTVGSGAGAGGATGTVKPWSAGKRTIPSDGDGPHIQASDVNPAFEASGADLAFLRAVLDMNVLKVVDYTATGAFTDTAPAGAQLAVVIGAGGGGGGGGGAGAGNATSRAAVGGAGGAGAVRTCQEMPVVPGTVYNGVVGAGGAAGAAGAAAGNGGIGGLGTDSSFDSLVFPGGGGGCAGIYFTVAGEFVLSPGGSTTKTAGSALVGATGGGINQLYMGVFFARCAGEGGYSQNDTTAASPGSCADGVRSDAGFAGGAHGANGVGAAGPHIGGAGGGGGGGGGFGVGGVGGTGAAGNAGGIGADAGGGATPAANTGGGGGGGGGGGAGIGVGGIGGAGGVGGSGRVRIIYLGATPQ